MCGRYTLVNLKSFVDDLPWASLFPGAEDLPARYNIAPTQNVPILANRPEFRLELARWGLIPSWAQDPAIGNRMINARAETVAEKPAFRTALRKRRCLIPADGFFEWKTLPGERRKQPMYIRLRSGRPFAFAGLWEVWRASEVTDEWVVSCTILTTTPNTLMADIHNRMPVILPREHYQRWLNPADTPGLEAMLLPYPAGEMEAYPVTPAVGNPRHDSPDNIVPLTPT